LDVHSGEGKLVTLLFFHSFCIGITRTFAEAASSALFLVKFDAHDLPVMYIGISMVVLLTGLIYRELGKRLSLTRLLTVNLTSILVALCGARLLFQATEARWPAFLLAVGFEVIWVLTSLEFWALAGRSFNVRQGKRLFGLVGTGGVIATILGGAAVPALVTLIGTANLLWLAAGGIALALATMFYIVRVQQADENTQPFSTRNKPENYRALLKNRFVLLIFVLAALAMIGRYFVDTVYLIEVETQYPDENQLASFFGVFLAVSAILTVLSRVFLSGSLLTRFGVIAGLLILPVLLLLGTGLVAGVWATFGAVPAIFWLVAGIMLVDNILRYSVNRASVQVLYQPLSPNQRLWVQTTSESVVEAIAGAIAGVTLLLFQSALFFGTLQLTYALIVVAIAWIAVVVMLNSEYIAILTEALTSRRLTGIALSLEDNASIAILKRGLNSTRPGEVIYSMNMLEEIGHREFTDLLPGLLIHTASEVRQEVLARIERLYLTSAIDAVRDRAELDPVPQIRGAALRTWSSLGGMDTANQILPYLDDPDPNVSVGAMVALLRNGGVEGGTPAGKRLVRYLNSPDPAEREFAAHVFGEIRYRNLHPQLARLLRDSEARVRRAALVAAGKLQQRELWPLVIENLTSPQVGSVAVAALASADNSVLPELEAAFIDKASQRDLLVRVIRVCSRIRGREVTALLRSKLDFPDPEVRYHILSALRACSYSARENGEMALIQRKIADEVREAAHTLAAIDELPRDNSDDGTITQEMVSAGRLAELDPIALLKRALEVELEGTRKRIFLLLSFLYNPESVIRARDNIAHNSSERRAYALEIIDVLLSQDSQELRPLVLPLMEDLPLAEKLHLLSDYYPHTRMSFSGRVKLLLTARDVGYWTKTCALYTVAKSGMVEYAESVNAALNSGDMLVRETALWALQTLSPGLYRLYEQDRQQTSGDSAALADNQIETGIRGQPMLLTVEKVIILKTVSIFAETDEDLLAKVASIMEEQEVPTGGQIIQKGDIGNCMYIIVSGKVRVHDGERTIAHLGEREVVGELALLDAEPRNASVTAEEDTLLLRLDQEAFYELMADHTEVARGIIRTLTRRLRATSAS
jgi:ATP/ADP translocase/HEAT repeat protein